jgi:hypothetical protein
MFRERDKRQTRRERQTDSVKRGEGLGERERDSEFWPSFLRWPLYFVGFSLSFCSLVQVRYLCSRLKQPVTHTKIDTTEYFRVSQVMLDWNPGFSYPTTVTPHPHSVPPSRNRIKTGTSMERDQRIFRCLIFTS